MRNNFEAILAATLIAVTAPSIAQQVQPATAQAAEPVFAEAQVRKVDKSAGKVTLKHGEIKSLDMPPMTMVFGVKNAAMLDQVKAGDKIRFRASNEGGAYTVTEIEPAK